MIKTDIAWAAGLFEGEGTMVVRQPKGRGRYPTAMMALQMRDRDVVERFAAIAGCGTMRTYRRSQHNPLHSDMAMWQVANRADCLRLARLFLPYLGERRKARALEVIEAASLKDGRSLRYKK